jgi:hypothetical protein
MTEQKNWQIARREAQAKLHGPRIPYGYQAPLNPRSQAPPRWQDALTRDGRRLSAERDQRGVAPDYSQKPVIFTAGGGIENYDGMTFEEKRRAQTLARK